MTRICEKISNCLAHSYLLTQTATPDSENHLTIPKPVDSSFVGKQPAVRKP